jgi:hypothetical protein
VPYLEFECPNGHVTEKFFKLISEGEAVTDIHCETCYQRATKIISRPLGFGLYGDPAGYDKPSATKRFNTKVVSQKEGNAKSVG